MLEVLLLLRFMIQDKKIKQMYKAQKECKKRRVKGTSAPWDVVNHKPCAQSTCMVFCKIGNLLVPSGREVKVLSLQSGECIRHLRGHLTDIVSLQINPLNHIQVLTCSEDGKVIQWDYQDGSAIKKFDLKLQSVAGFYAPSTNNIWYVIVGRKGKDFELLALKVKLKGIIKKFVLKPVQPYQNCISFGLKGELVCGVYKNDLRVLHLSTNVFKIHKTGTRNLTCIACHPVDCSVATGDDSGRILVWSGMLENNHPVRSIYHWHTLPVADLAFSAEGTYLYSGGGESVLVKWKLGSEHRHFLPRMGLPLICLASSPDNSYVATCHVDNAIHIVNAHNRVVKIYQGLTHGYQHRNYEHGKVLPTGMIYDPRTKALVMNGKPGHLQFYLLHQDKQLFNLDIVGHNYISQERSLVVINVELDKAAIDDQGFWLATVEYRKDGDGDRNPIIILKFWNFDLISQMFVLNTRVYLPHLKKVNAVKFQPIPVICKNHYSHLAVTTSDDKRFKTWTLTSNSKKSDKKSSWNCESMGYYKDLPAKDASFSKDGSLLAVTFAHVVTLWTPATTTLKATICHPTSKDAIQQVIFGRDACAHLIICCSSNSLIVWNVLTLSVMWTIPLGVQYLVSDPISTVMAVFTNDNDLFVFDPSNPKPLYIHNAVCQTAIISAVFIPKETLEHSKNPASNVIWHHHSQLFFMDQSQTLLTVTDEVNSEEPLKVVKTEKNYSYSLIRTVISRDKAGSLENKKHYLYPIKKSLNGKEINEIPSHMSLSVSKICSNFLLALLPQKEKYN